MNAAEMFNNTVSTDTTIVSTDASTRKLVKNIWIDNNSSNTNSVSLLVNDRPIYSNVKVPMKSTVKLENENISLDVSSTLKVKFSSSFDFSNTILAADPTEYGDVVTRQLYYVDGKNNIIVLSTYTGTGNAVYYQVFSSEGSLIKAKTSLGITPAPLPALGNVLGASTSTPSIRWNISENSGKLLINVTGYASTSTYSAIMDNTTYTVSATLADTTTTSWGGDTSEDRFMFLFDEEKVAYISYSITGTKLQVIVRSTDLVTNLVNKTLITAVNTYRTISGCFQDGTSKLFLVCGNPSAAGGAYPVTVTSAGVSVVGAAFPSTFMTPNAYTYACRGANNNEGFFYKSGGFYYFYGYANANSYTDLPLIQTKINESTLASTSTTLVSKLVSLPVYQSGGTAPASVAAGATQHMYSYIDKTTGVITSFRTAYITNATTGYGYTVVKETYTPNFDMISSEVVASDSGSTSIMQYFTAIGSITSIGAWSQYLQGKRKDVPADFLKSVFFYSNQYLPSTIASTKTVTPSLNIRADGLVL